MVLQKRYIFMDAVIAAVEQTQTKSWESVASKSTKIN